MKLLIIALFFSASAIANEPNVERQKELRNMLAHDCGSCHGLTLKGGLGPSLLAKDLANKNSAFLVQAILEGRKGTAMPPWKPFLSEQEAMWLVQKLLKQQ
jgi:cytochrome c55X